MHGSRWRGLETEHRLDKDAEVAHPTGKPTERRLRVLQPERATAPVPDPTFVDHVPAAAQAARTARVSCGEACSGHGLRNLAAMMTRRSFTAMSS
jgi:hypothetical protein